MVVGSTAALSFGNPLLSLVGGTIHLSGTYDEEGNSIEFKLKGENFSRDTGQLIEI